MQDLLVGQKIKIGIKKFELAACGLLPFGAIFQFLELKANLLLCVINSILTACFCHYGVVWRHIYSEWDTTEEGEVHVYYCSN